MANALVDGLSSSGPVPLRADTDGTQQIAIQYLRVLLAGESQPLGLMFTADGGTEYETVAASQTTQALGAVGGVGDLLSRLICVVTTAATAQVQIKDGADTAITVFPNSPGGGVGTYTIPIGLISRTGAWQVTTGAGVAVIACGNFS
jgi:hypothetical protein